MIYKFEEKQLKSLLSNYSRAIVGKICEQNEILESEKTVSKEECLRLLKKFNKSLIYQSFRDLESQLKVVGVGQKYTKFNIYTPNDK